MMGQRQLNARWVVAVCGGALGTTLLLLLGGCSESSSPASQATVAKPPADVKSVGDANAPRGQASDTKPAAAKSGSAPPPGYVRDVTFDTVKFNMKKEDPFQRSMLTAAIEAMDGSRIRIRGFILPPLQNKGLRHFVLVRDNMSCCFGPGALLFDAMVVDMPAGQTIDYTVAPVMVEGTFNIRVVALGDGGKVLSIYHLAADKVR